MNMDIAAFSKSELSILVDMYLDGYGVKKIAKVLDRTVNEIKQEVEFKGLNDFKINDDYKKFLKPRAVWGVA